MIYDLTYRMILKEKSIIFFGFIYLFIHLFTWQCVVLFDWKQGNPLHKWTGHTRDVTKVGTLCVCREKNLAYMSKLFL